MQEIKGFICDMDGVIYRGNKIIPSAKVFFDFLIKHNLPFLFLTNNSESSQTELKIKLNNLGITGISEKNFITASMATATFLQTQKPKAKIFVIGAKGLVEELTNAGFILTDQNPDYVVVGKTKDFNFDLLKKAINLIINGAKFIGTNPDLVDPVENGIEPACGTILAAIEQGSGKKPYVIGKPNSLIMAIAINKLNLEPNEILMIGDRMDTDIIAGLEAGLTTCLALSGVTKKEELKDFAYQPNYIFKNISEIISLLPSF